MIKSFLALFAICIVIGCKKKSAEEYLKSGESKYNAEDLIGALNDYNKAIELKPNFENAYHNRGICIVLK